MLWLALALPIVAAIVLAIFFSKKMHVLEFVGLFAIPLVVVAITRFSAESIMVTDTEYWGGYATQARYFEDWNEYIHQTCTRSYPCGSDSEGNTTYCTELYDCSYVAYHPEYWEFTDSNDETFGITQQQYLELVRRWNNQAFVDMGRNYYTNDGDAYVTNFDKVYEHSEITTMQHTYENRVQASHSIFNFPTFKPKQAKEMQLFNYPPVNGYQQASVLGIGVPIPKEWDRAVELVNGHLGRKCKSRVYVLIWRDKPITTATNQQAYWKGGNKNELIVCISVDKDGRPQWCFPFGWTKLEGVKVNARDFVMKQKKLDVVPLANMLYKEIYPNILRRDFREFGYLVVDPPMWLVITVFMVVLLFCFGWGFWSATNDYDSDGDNMNRYRFRF
jgi:hypothetical protein